MPTATNVPEPSRSPALLRLAEVSRRTALRKTAIYQAMARGAFPRSVHLHGRAVAWLEAEIDQWIASRPRTEAERTNDNAPVAGTTRASAAHVEA